jgi:inosose dehydratase
VIPSDVAAAPVTWGVWERTVDRDDLVPRDALLDAVRSLGFDAIELGPPGYLGADGGEVRSNLEPYGLELVGGFVPLRLADDAAFASDLDELARTLDVLAEYPGAVALLADAGTPERFAAAGQPAELRRTALAGETLEAAVTRLAAAAQRCRDADVPAALHPEVGSYVESPAEIAAFLDALDEELLGLCLDTGHMLIGGGDPVALARRWSNRIVHVHLKDVSGALLERVRTGELDVERAWEDGLFCQFGDGVVDLLGVLDALGGYGGRIVVEQDRIAVRAADVEAVREAERRNLAYLVPPRSRVT